MKIIKSIFIITIFSLFTLSNIFSAEVVVHDTKVTETKTFENDYIFLGEMLNFSGKTDDLIFLGRNLNFSGETDNELSAFGSAINIRGIVGNNLNIAGSIVNVQAEVNGTTMIAGSEISIDEESQINSDIFIVGSKISVDAPVSGDLYIGGSMITINSVIEGDFRFSGAMINFGKNALIKGDFLYESDVKISDDILSKVEGEVKSVIWDKKKPGKIKPDWHKNNEKLKAGMVAGKLIFMFAILLSLFLTGLLFLLFPGTKKLIKNFTFKEFWVNMAWGLIPFFIYPVAVGVLMSIGIPGIILLLGFLPFNFFALIFGSICVGEMFFKLFKWKKESRFLYFMFGILPLVILGFIPGLNLFTFIIYAGSGWGIIIKMLFNNNKNKPADPPSQDNNKIINV